MTDEPGVKRGAMAKHVVNEVQLEVRRKERNRKRRLRERLYRMRLPVPRPYRPVKRLRHDWHGIDLEPQSNRAKRRGFAIANLLPVEMLDRKRELGRGDRQRLQAHRRRMAGR